MNPNKAATRVGANAKLLYKREYKPKTELRPSLPKRQNMYKTTGKLFRDIFMVFQLKHFYCFS